LRQDPLARRRGAQSPGLHLMDQLLQLQDLAGTAATHLVNVQLGQKRQHATSKRIYHQIAIELISIQ
jgi:hypothetical protein